MADFYDELLSATEQARDDFIAIPALGKGVSGDISLNTYLAFLTQAYYHVKHTVPLLMACGARVDSDHEWVRVALGHYIEEEMGHEEWILNDIKACGGNPESVRHGVPHPATEVMVAYAYDTIYRNNPMGFFGMVLVLEGTSIRLATDATKAIQTSLGLPNNAFSYLNSHGSLDIEHMDFFSSLMNRITSDDDKISVIHCAKMFYKLYGDIFRALPLDK